MLRRTACAVGCVLLWHALACLQQQCHCRIAAAFGCGWRDKGNVCASDVQRCSALLLQFVCSGACGSGEDYDDDDARFTLALISVADLTICDICMAASCCNKKSVHSYNVHAGTFGGRCCWHAPKSCTMLPMQNKSTHSFMSQQLDACLLAHNAVYACCC